MVVPISHNDTMIPNNTTSDILSMRHSLKQQHHRFNTTSSHHRSITIPSHNSTSNHIDTSTLTSFISSLQPQTDLSQFMHLLHTDPSQTSLDMDLYLATSPSPPKSNPSPFSLLAQRRNSTEEEGFMGLLSGQRDVERMEGMEEAWFGLQSRQQQEKLEAFRTDVSQMRHDTAPTLDVFGTTLSMIDLNLPTLDSALSTPSSAISTSPSTNPFAMAFDMASPTFSLDDTPNPTSQPQRRPGRPKGSVNKSKKRSRSSDDESDDVDVLKKKRGRKPKPAEPIRIPTPVSSPTRPIDPASPSLAPTPQPPTLLSQTLTTLPASTPYPTLLSTLRTLSTPSPTSSSPETRAYRHLLTTTQTRLGRWHQARLLWSLSTLRPRLIAAATHMSESDHVVKEYMIRKSVQDVTRLMEYSGTPWCVWRGEQGGEILAAGAGFDTLVPTPLTSTTLITDLWDAESVVEYWEAFTSLCTGEMKTEVEVKKGTCVSRARVEGDGIRGRCVFVKEDGGEVPCAFWMSVRRDAWGGVGVVVGQFLPIGRW